MKEEARHIIAKIFEGVGGIEAAIKWAKNNRAVFYTQLYAKLIPMTIGGQINASVESDAATAALALEGALMRVIASRKDEAAAVVIEHEPRAKERVINPQAADGRPQTAGRRPQTIDGRPQSPTAKPAAAPRAVERVINPEPAAAAPASADNVVTPRLEALTPEQAKQRAMAPLPQPTRNEPSATELFYEYHGTRRLWWGPVGGSPP